MGRLMEDGAEVGVPWGCGHQSKFFWSLLLGFGCKKRSEPCREWKGLKCCLKAWDVDPSGSWGSTHQPWTQPEHDLHGHWNLRLDVAKRFFSKTSPIGTASKNAPVLKIFAGLERGRSLLLVQFAFIWLLLGTDIVPCAFKLFYLFFLTLEISRSLI